MANLGPGFDVFGLALDTFHDLVEVKFIEKGITIIPSGKYGALVPSDPKRNTAGVVAELFLKGAEVKTGVELRIEKGIKPGYGLGSSGASAAGAAVALNRLLGMHCSSSELIAIAAEGEVASAGSPHADNVAAAILGGFTIIISHNPLEAISLPVPKELELALVIPHIQMPESKTGFARLILPDRIKLSQMVFNIGNSSALVAGFALCDINLIGKGMCGFVVEPLRAKFIPCYEKVKRNAIICGALGVAISGSGPSLVAIVDQCKTSAQKVADSMKETFVKEGIEAEAYCVRSGGGARILEYS